MGLREISGSAISTGVTTAISIKTGIDPSETGIASMIVNQLSQLVDAKTHESFVLISFALGVLSIVLTIYFIRKVITYGGKGILIAGLGFSGPMIMLLSPVSNILLILIGAFMAIGSGYMSKNYHGKF